MVVLSALRSPEFILLPIRNRLHITVDGTSSPAIFHYNWVLQPSVPAATCSPAEIAFLNQTADEPSQQTLTIYAPSPSEKVMVSVTGDTSGSTLTAAFATTLTFTLPPSPEGPHPPPGSPPQTETKVILSPEARAMKAGQALVVQVDFTPWTAPARYQASIVIQGEGWQPLTIPVTAAVTNGAPPVGVVQGAISAVAINSLAIQQGGSAILGVRVTSSAPQPVSVRLTYQPDVSEDIGLTMQPATVTVQPGGTTQTGLTFQADPSAVVIANLPLQIFGAAPNLACALSGASATVSYGTVTVMPYGPGPGIPNPSVRFTQGYPGSLPVWVTVEGAATSISFDMTEEPEGIFFAYQVFPLAAGGAQMVTLQFVIGEQAPLELLGKPLVLNWNAYGTAVSGSLQMDAVIFSQFQNNLQEQTNWCWAATTVNIANYYLTASGFTQCLLANDLTGTNNCCADPGPCNQGQDLEQSLKITRNWVQTYTTSTPYYSMTSGPIGSADLANQVLQGLPVGVRIQWAPGTSSDDFQHPAHAIAVSNVDLDDLFVVNDPFYGVSAIPYETLVNAYQGSGIWTHGYTTTAGSTPSGFAA